MTPRQRLLQSAVELFAVQGVTETTTRQIAERAEVNEVTLFRQFGNKHGLLLAVLEESPWLEVLGAYLQEPSFTPDTLRSALHTYIEQHLTALAHAPAFIRSVIGEAVSYPPSHREALGQALRQANQFATEYFMQTGALRPNFRPQHLAALFNCLLLGYTLVEFTSESHQLWQTREDFLGSFLDLLLEGGFTLSIAPPPIRDLSPSLVHTLLEHAKKSSPQLYALVYLLFATGLTPIELAQLQQRHHRIEKSQALLILPLRQVPINQHIQGKHYGSPTNNPLTQYLKKRKDQEPALLLDPQGHPLTPDHIRSQWQTLTASFQSVTLPGELEIQQTQHTWAVEMLYRGLTPEQLSLLSGLSLAALQPYTHRLQEKIALEQVLKLDR